MLFFHGNAEDLNLSFELINVFRTILCINVLAVEYPGYGVYKGKPSSKALIQDAECIYEFVKKTLKFPSKDIFVFGRSIGTGPATHLARYKRVGCLLLMSAYTSIKAVAKHIGKFLSCLIKERFNNIENIKHITCPVFLVHGKMDQLIPYTHSLLLQEACNSPCSLHIPSHMEHDRFDYCEDLVLPISAFLTQSRITIDKPKTQLKISQELCWPSPGQVIRVSGGRIFKLLKKFA
jgi:fermentation-respiration switch protein FrsA (DUF1100 family)